MLPAPRAALPVRRGSVCREHLAGLGSAPAADVTSVRSFLRYSSENLENRPDH